MTQNPDIEFLNFQLQIRQKAYETLQELCPRDLLPTSDNPPKTSEDEERCARLADQYGFDGSLFRNLFSLSPNTDGIDLSVWLARVCKQIETLPRIVAAIESEEAERQTGAILPGKRSKHFSPKELTKIYGLSWDTIKKRLDSGEIRHIKHTTKDYQIHLDDLPPNQI